MLNIANPVLKTNWVLQLGLQMIKINNSLKMKLRVLILKYTVANNCKLSDIYGFTKYVNRPKRDFHKPGNPNIFTGL